MAYWKGLFKDYKIYIMTFSMRIQIKAQDGVDDFRNNFQISATPTKFLLCILQEGPFQQVGSGFPEWKITSCINFLKILRKSSAPSCDVIWIRTKKSI